MPSESTLKQYAMRMSILKKNGIDAMRSPQSVLDWFDSQKFSASSRKVYLSAIKNSVGDQFPALLQSELNRLYTNQNKKDMEQTLTEKQQENFVKWEDLLTAYEKLKTMNKSAAQLKHYLVMSLYILNAPVRADYGEMEVFSRKDKTRTGNELIWNKNPCFVFRVYKTAKTYGEVVIPVSKPLQIVITEWFAHLGSVPNYLLGDKPTSPNTFAVFVQDTFRKYTGKDVGISLLRHAFITHMFPSLKTIKQKEDLANRMLHDRQRQEMYRVVDDV